MLQFPGSGPADFSLGEFASQWSVTAGVGRTCKTLQTTKHLLCSVPAEGNGQHHGDEPRAEAQGRGAICCQRSGHLECRDLAGALVRTDPR